MHDFNEIVRVVVGLHPVWDYENSDDVTSAREAVAWALAHAEEIPEGVHREAVENLRKKS